MDIRNMNELYTELIRGTCRGFKGRNLVNPAIPFTERAKAGEYDDLTDEEYDGELDKIKELNKVWCQAPSRTVGELLLTALENIDLQDKDLKTIAAALMRSYERSDQEHIPCDSEIVRRPCGSVVQNGWKEKGYSSQNGSEYDDEPDMEFVDGEENPTARILRSPAGIYEYLDKNVYGQTEAKKAAAMLLWNHINGRRQNVVFAGPTGCGKTEIFRQLSKLYPNIVIHNATSITGTGWKGNMKVRNLFDGVDIENQEHLIIVLDEADKMFEDVSEKHYSYVIQNELLKLMEGDMVHFEGNPMNNEPTVDIDTSNVSFVFLGSFDSMVKAKDIEVNKNRTIGFGSESSSEKFEGYTSIFTQDDLVKYANIRSEVAGRISSIVQLGEMSETDFYNILCEENVSPVNKLAEYYGIKIKMSASAKHKLAKEAATNKMGVRYMRSRIQRTLDEMMFSDCEKTEYKIG